jgi:hypothetical protein
MGETTKTRQAEFGKSAPCREPKAKPTNPMEELATNVGAQRK